MGNVDSQILYLAALTAPALSRTPTQQIVDGVGWLEFRNPTALQDLLSRGESL